MTIASTTTGTTMAVVPLVETYEDGRWVPGAFSEVTAGGQRAGATIGFTLRLKSDSGLELVVDIGPEVPEAIVTDPVKLKQILLNLLSVAIHRAPGAQVRLSARSEDEEIEICIQSIRTGATELRDGMHTTAETDRASLRDSRSRLDPGGGACLAPASGASWHSRLL